VTNNGDALLELINGILDLARIDSGCLSLEQACFDLESLVDRLTVSNILFDCRMPGQGP
jgi:signal transduction histidine kinase